MVLLLSYLSTTYIKQLNVFVERRTFKSHEFPQILNICLFKLFHDQVEISSVPKRRGQEVEGEHP